MRVARRACSQKADCDTLVIFQTAKPFHFMTSRAREAEEREGTSQPGISQPYPNPSLERMQQHVVWAGLYRGANYTGDCWHGILHASMHMVARAHIQSHPRAWSPQSRDGRSLESGGETEFASLHSRPRYLRQGSGRSTLSLPRHRSVPYEAMYY